MRLHELTEPTANPVNNPTKVTIAYKLFRTDAKGNLYPLYINNKTALPIGKWLPAEIGAAAGCGKVNSKLGPLAMRPGWHAGDLPIATHIGGKSQGKTQKKPDYRPDNQVWAIVEMADDVDWQSEAEIRAYRN